MENSMGRENIFYLMDKLGVGHGIREKELVGMMKWKIDFMILFFTLLIYTY